MAKTCKYQRLQKYVSYDNGQTWTALNEFKIGDLIDSSSIECSDGTVTLYEWRVVQGEYECDGTAKYEKLQKYVSLDNGDTYVAVTPSEYKKGNVIEYESTDCGGVGTLTEWFDLDPTTDYECDECYQKIEGGVLFSLIKNSIIMNVDCDDSFKITKDKIDACGADISTSISIGNCTRFIGDLAFYNYIGGTAPHGVILPNEGIKNVINIGDYAFSRVNISEGNTIICHQWGLTNYVSKNRYNTRITEAQRVPCPFYDFSSIRRIGAYAFYKAYFYSAENYKVNIIKFGKNLTSVDDYAFYDLSSNDLFVFVFSSTVPPNLGIYPFDTSQCIIAVPFAALERYKAAFGDKYKKYIVPIYDEIYTSNISGGRNATTGYYSPYILSAHTTLEDADNQTNSIGRTSITASPLSTKPYNGMYWSQSSWYGFTL